MEPESHKQFSGPEEPHKVALVSIAISLKRIADQIEGVAYDYTPGADNSGHRIGLVDGIATAIEQAIIGAARTR